MEKIDRILRPREVCSILGISRATLWRKEQRGELPQKKRVSAGAVGYLKSEILEMIDNSNCETEGGLQK
ncbi:hypothetical protein BH23BAC3_BH23BAC3_35010 [soil metagenome]